MDNLSGTIPSTFSDLANLSALNLSQNSFTREIREIGKLSKLSNLNLQGNRFSVVIPISISSLRSLIDLNLGNNSLTGTIPAMPTSLSAILNLSQNHLSGYIPSNIGYLTELEILNLLYNNLSGQVPFSLGSLQSLTQLVLSYNHLSGPLPKFSRNVALDITGNPGLTNGKGNNNGTSTSGKRRTHTLLSSSSFAIAGALVGLCSLAAIAMVSLSKRIYRVDDEGPSVEVGVAQVINGHLITMNSIHTSAIDFMKAMEAVSNHNNIFLKTRFCTYYKAMMPNGSSYSVKKLNWSDKIFQIGSQEKFGHELEVGNLSNSNVMVPLAYVSTKDNAYLLYEHMYNGTVFDLLHD